MLSLTATVVVLLDCLHSKLYLISITLVGYFKNKLIIIFKKMSDFPVIVFRHYV